MGPVLPQHLTCLRAVSGGANVTNKSSEDFFVCFHSKSLQPLCPLAIHFKTWPQTYRMPLSFKDTLHLSSWQFDRWHGSSFDVAFLPPSLSKALLRFRTVDSTWVMHRRLRLQTLKLDLDSTFVITNPANLTLTFLQRLDLDTNPGGATWGIQGIWLWLKTVETAHKLETNSFCESGSSTFTEIINLCYSAPQPVLS